MVHWNALLGSSRNAVIFDTTMQEKCTAHPADRVVLMRHGEKVEKGPVAEIFANPQHAYTKGLLACRPRLGVRRERLPMVDDFICGNA
jgi:peptide/nickel transport system ATP-binding protein